MRRVIVVSLVVSIVAVFALPSAALIDTTDRSAAGTGITGSSDPLGLLPELTGGTTASPATHLTRVRIHLETTSEWASARLQGTTFVAYKVISASPGATVEVLTRRVLVHGPAPASAEVLALAEVPTGSTPSVKLRKAKIGDTTVTLSRSLTETEDVVISEIYGPDGVDTLVVPVSRSALVAAGFQIPMMDARRLVLAHYYPWFGSGTFNSGLWWDKPLVPYDTTTPTSVRAMIDQAAAHGVDGFMFSYGEGDNIVERYNYVVDAAGDRGGFLVAPSIPITAIDGYSAGASVAQVVSMIKGALARSAESVFVKVGNRPVVFLYGTWGITSADWANARAQLQAAGLNPFVVGDSIDQEYGFDGFYRYNPNGLATSTVRSNYTSWSRAIRLQSQVDSTVPQRLWAATVSPGENNIFYQPMGPTIQDRENGVRYDQMWSAALNSAPEWILVTSWNEFYEATHIAPGAKTGSVAIDRTMKWSAQF